MLQKSDASNRPFETVKPLAVSLGMEPTQGQRTPETGSGNVFDNRFDVSAHEVSVSALQSLGSVCGHPHAECALDQEIAAQEAGISTHSKSLKFCNHSQDARMLCDGSERPWMQRMDTGENTRL